jgi:hypothetical protein
VAVSLVVLSGNHWLVRRLKGDIKPSIDHSMLLPLASTITPGTLSIGVAPVHHPPLLQMHVPNVDFVSLNYVANMLRPSQGEDSTRNTIFEYRGHSSDVVRITNSVIQTGSILQINSPHRTARWTLDFDGLGISYAEVSESTQSVVRRQLRNTVFDPNNGGVVQGYIAWNDTDTGYSLPKNTPLSFHRLNNVDPGANPNNACLIDKNVLKTLSYQATEML